MITKTTISKIVACFFSMLIFSIFSSNLNAQIIYTDIPDATPSATYPLDLNNDGVEDFLIQFDLGDKVMCKPQNGNAYSGEIVDGEHLPWALSLSVNICDSLETWYDAEFPGTMAWGTSTGNWIGATDKYLALKLVVGVDTYYGWARLDVMPGSTSFTVKDYAYASTPNACIQAGQTIVGVFENSMSSVFYVYPNPFISFTTIRTNYNLKNATLTFSNSYGQIVKQIERISGSSIPLFREDLPSGLYFIRLIEENKLVAVEKMIIAD